LTAIAVSVLCFVGGCADTPPAAIRDGTGRHCTLNVSEPHATVLPRFVANARACLDKGVRSIPVFAAGVVVQSAPTGSTVELIDREAGRAATVEVTAYDYRKRAFLSIDVTANAGTTDISWYANPNMVTWTEYGQMMRQWATLAPTGECP
jgi:hypothetical protein